MEKFIIQGGNKLNGSVRISGAKNSVVAILPAILLSDGVCRIENVPNISDVSVTLKILYELGAKVRMINQSTFEIDPTGINSYVMLHYDKIIYGQINEDEEIKSNYILKAGIIFAKSSHILSVE